MLKKCQKCNKELEKEKSFYHRKTSPDGYATICISCTKISKPRKIVHIKEGLLLCLNCKQYKNLEEFSIDNKCLHRDCKFRYCKQCHSEMIIERKINKRGKPTLERLITMRFLGARQRAKVNDLVFDIDKEFLNELWNVQQGKCAISGTQMTYEYYKGRIPTNLSIDRKDSNRGYTKDNTQLVCMVVNQMKSDLTMEELLNFCESILKWNKK